MKSEEALDQIAFMKDLLTKTRLSSAEGYPYYILWGIIWIVGYLSNIWLPPYTWTLLCIAGGIGSYAIGVRHQFKPSDLKLLKRIGLQAVILFITSLAFFAVLIYTKMFTILYAFWPFECGVIYMVAGVFMGKDLLGIGTGITIAALASLLMPSPYHLIFLAIVAGGGLLLTGILFRNQVKKRG